MQKFNLWEVVKTKKTGVKKPGVIYKMETGLGFFNNNANPQCYKLWSDLFGEQIKDEAIYYIQLPVPIRPISFDEFCRYHNIAPNDDSRTVYKNSVVLVQQICTCERDIEFIADSMEDFIDSFRNLEEYQEFLETYECIT